MGNWKLRSARDDFPDGVEMCAPRLAFLLHSYPISVGETVYEAVAIDTVADVAPSAAGWALVRRGEPDVVYGLPPDATLHEGGPVRPDAAMVDRFDAELGALVEGALRVARATKDDLRSTLVFAVGAVRAEALLADAQPSATTAVASAGAAEQLAQSADNSDMPLGRTAVLRPPAVDRNVVGLIVARSDVAARGSGPSMPYTPRPRAVVLGDGRGRPPR